MILSSVLGMSLIHLRESTHAGILKFKQGSNDPIEETINISRVSSKLNSTSLSKFALIYSKNEQVFCRKSLLSFHFSEVPDKTELLSWSLPVDTRNVTCAVGGAFPRPRVRIQRSTAWGTMSVSPPLVTRLY